MRSDRALIRACLAGAMVGLVALAGCGKKGPLEAPGAVAGDAAPTTAYPAGGAQQPAETAPPPPPPHEPFALDPLL